MPVDNFLFSYVAQEEEYNEGEALIKEGSRGDWVYLILQGRVKVKKTTPKGMVTIDTLLEGDIFGEMILWQSGKGARSASIIAETYVRVGVLDTQRLIKEYESISPRLKSLIMSLIQRLAETTTKAVILAVETK
jgi:CRP-like cAMP-binding protein